MQGVQGSAGTQGGARVAAQRPVDTGFPARQRDAAVPAAARGEHTHGERPVPVRRTSVRGQILDALRTALSAGELRPGEVYSAPVLGERFGVSATPVREAMQQLAWRAPSRSCPTAASW